MVNLCDDRKTAILKALDDGQLPKRACAIELLGHEAPNKGLQLFLGSGVRQRDVSHVILKIEMLIINPHRMALKRNGCDSLAIPRD